MLGDALRHLDNVRIETLKGLVVDFATRPRRGDHREGPAGRLRLRLRAADGPDEQEPVGDRHHLHLHRPRVLVPLVESRVRGGEVRRRRVLHGAPGGVGAAGGAVLERSEAAMGDEQAYDLETLLLQIREIIDTARTMPMSASVLVNREETLEIVDDALRLAARGAAPRALVAQGARGVPRAGPPRRRGHRRSRPGAGRADGRAHRGGAGGAARRPAGRRPRGGRQPAPAPRGRGLHRPEAGVVRGGARAHDADGAARAASSSRPSSGRCRPTRPIDDAGLDRSTRSGLFDQDDL